MGLIYKVTNNINNKIYIGQTSKSLEIRRREHERYTYGAKRSYFHKALKKYGTNKFTWEIIDQANNKVLLDSKEIYWISHYCSYGKNGYNMTIGGDGGDTLSCHPNKKDIYRRVIKNTRLKYKKENHSQYKYVDESICTEIIALYNDYISPYKIGEQFGLSKSLVYRILKDHNILIHKMNETRLSYKTYMKLNHDDKVDIVNLYEKEEYSILELEKIYSHAIIMMIFKEFNVKLRGQKVTFRRIKKDLATRKNKKV